MRFLVFTLLLMLSIPALAQQYHLFIGTYTATGSKGIYVYRFDAGAGTLEEVSHADSVSNPSFLALHPSGRYLYACNENRPGAVSAFAFDRTTGRLTFINQQGTGGDHPAYVAVDKEGRWLLAGNYSSGNLSAFPISADGSLQPYSQLIQHTGKGVDPQRQQSPHVHSTLFEPGTGDHVFVQDLGIDKIMIYPFDPSSKTPLKESAAKAVLTTPGSGPRHLAFHPSGQWAYLMEEMGGTVSVYRHKHGALKCQQRIAAHADSFKGPYGSADIHVSPDGRFLYASNRGTENNMAIFAIDGRKGTLTPAGFQSTLGEQPRNFTLDPTGRFLLVANQRSGTVVVFKRDPQTGGLQPTGVTVSVPQPVHLLFHP